LSPYHSSALKLPVHSFASFPFSSFSSPSTFSLSLFYLFRYYFHSPKDKERLKNKWSQLCKEEEEEVEEEGGKGANFPVLLDKHGAPAWAEGDGMKNFLG
jgi:hypothetical protein